MRILQAVQLRLFALARRASTPSSNSDRLDSLIQREHGATAPCSFLFSQALWVSTKHLEAVYGYSFYLTFGVNNLLSLPFIVRVSISVAQITDFVTLSVLE